MTWNQVEKEKLKGKHKKWCNENNKQINDGSKEGITTVAETRKKSDAVMEG